MRLLVVVMDIEPYLDHLVNFPPNFLRTFKQAVLILSFLS